MQELILLGTGTAIPTPRRAPSGMLIDGPDGAVLVDPGPGALQRACWNGVPFERIDCVLLTHHHPDHSLDLAAVLFARHLPRAAGTLREPLVVAGGPGTVEFVERFPRVYGGWVMLPGDRLEVRELSPGPFRLCGLEGEAFAMRHTPASLGYRLTGGDGLTLALSGDTDACDAAVALGRGADLYVLECSHPDGGHVEGHLTPALAGEIARAAECSHLVLTHFYPEVDVEQARRTVQECFAGRVTIAEDGMRLPLRRAGPTPGTVP